jgi:hypothetical protein
VLFLSDGEHHGATAALRLKTTVNNDVWKSGTGGGAESARWNRVFRWSVVKIQETKNARVSSEVVRLILSGAGGLSMA